MLERVLTAHTHRDLWQRSLPAPFFLAPCFEAKKRIAEMEQQRDMALQAKQVFLNFHEFQVILFPPVGTSCGKIYRGVDQASLVHSNPVDGCISVHPQQRSWPRNFVE